MNQRLFLLVFLATVFTSAAMPVFAQTPAAKQSGYTLITPDLLRPHLKFLASDELEGRETAKRGQKIAARYIATQFERLGLKPFGDSGTYFQKFSVTEQKIGGGSKFVIASKPKRGSKVETTVNSSFLEDFYFFPRGFGITGDSVKGAVVFLGYGINDLKTYKYSDYSGLDVKGKIVVVMAGEPQAQSKESVFNGDQPTRWSNWATKRTAAIDAGAAAVLMVNDLGGLPFLPQQVEPLRDVMMSGTMSLVGSSSAKEIRPESRVQGTPLIFISSALANQVLKSTGKTVDALQKGMEKNGRPASFEIAGVSLTIAIDFQKKILETENVCGLLEGSDEKLKDELIVYTGHYDHLGITDSGVINNGADDDGSGTTAVIALAEAFARNGERPKRSILFMTVAGEEKGLLGSKYYTDHPKWPLEKTVADFNIDMVGRIDPKYDALKNPNYVYVIGSDKISKELDELLQKQNKETVNLTLDYTYNDENDPNRFYYRSDHYNFAKNGIPIIFFFNGTHADYHKPTDDVEKINFDKMSLITRLAFSVGWETANRANGLKKNAAQP
ncbi:MAG: M20/M25/M40 family metallo-hydrolase [Rhizobacter sp.]|nr:M20/M25/M40 family metallo-hydrolase [Chlorobiales bacterium]